jgi:hypothetical protein
MNYAGKMGSHAKMYVQSFIQIGLTIQNLIGWDIQTHRQHADRISLHSFFLNEESRLKICIKMLYITFTSEPW